MANQALTRLAIFLAAFIITLGLIEVTAYSVQKDEQIRFAHEVLHEAEDASEQITDALTVTNTIAEPSCDTATMTVIRQLVHENSEIYDIGFMNDESVLCTANWGAISPRRYRQQIPNRIQRLSFLQASRTSVSRRRQV